ncbi:hypothetical protein V2I01_30560 [Micromonospora sp. BRA006-A]|nr:hypothetical protein [Micromonospora sp. BRA006-A]
MLPALSTWRRRRDAEAALDSWRYRVAWQPLADDDARAEATDFLLVVPADADAAVTDWAAALGAAGRRIVEIDATCDRKRLAHDLAEASTGRDGDAAARPLPAGPRPGRTPGPPPCRRASPARSRSRRPSATPGSPPGSGSPPAARSPSDPATGTPTRAGHGVGPAACAPSTRTGGAGSSTSRAARPGRRALSPDADRRHRPGGRDRPRGAGGRPPARSCDVQRHRCARFLDAAVRC